MRAIELPEVFSKYDEAVATVESIDPAVGPFGGLCRSMLKVQVFRGGIGYESVLFVGADEKSYVPSDGDLGFCVRKADRFFSEIQ